MRVGLVRAFLLGDIVIIDSDLRSLDEKTREKVMAGIVTLKSSKTIFMRGEEKMCDYQITVKKGKEAKLVKN